MQLCSHSQEELAPNILLRHFNVSCSFSDVYPQSNIASCMLTSSYKPACTHGVVPDIEVMRVELLYIPSNHSINIYSCIINSLYTSVTRKVVFKY